MNTHMYKRFGALLAVIAGMAFAFVLMPTEARAQNDQVDNCICNVVTVTIDPNVSCRVTVCVVFSNGDIRCISVAPGQSASIVCTPGSRLYFRDCHNQLIPFPAPGQCVRGIGAAAPCCTVDACRSDDGCSVVVTPSILDVCPCL